MIGFMFNNLCNQHTHSLLHTTLSVSVKTREIHLQERLPASHKLNLFLHDEISIKIDEILFRFYIHKFD